MARYMTELVTDKLPCTSLSKLSDTDGLYTSKTRLTMYRKTKSFIDICSAAGNPGLHPMSFKRMCKLAFPLQSSIIYGTNVTHLHQSDATSPSQMALLRPKYWLSEQLCTSLSSPWVRAPGQGRAPGLLLRTCTPAGSTSGDQSCLDESAAAFPAPPP